MFYLLIGRGGHGKDTAKDIIQKNLDVTQIRMADYLKNFLIEVFELNKKSEYKNFHKKSDNKWYNENNELIANELLDILKEEKDNYIDKENNVFLNRDFRTIMQKLGTEYFRQEVDNNFHVKMVLKEILKSKKDFIFTDIRFNNEKDFALKSALKENFNQLSEFSNSFKIEKTFSELKKDFINIVLGEDSSISKKIEKNLDKQIKNIMKLNTGKTLLLEDLNLNENKDLNNVKILHIFRIIDDKDFKEQKQIYLKFKNKIKELYNLNVENEEELKKAMNIIGYIRTGMDDPEKVFHASEQELSLQKEYTQNINVISAVNLEELQSKILSFIKSDLNVNLENSFKI